MSNIHFEAHHIDSDQRQIYFDIYEDGQKCGKAFLSKYAWLQLLAALRGVNANFTYNFKGEINESDESWNRGAPEQQAMDNRRSLGFDGEEDR